MTFIRLRKFVMLPAVAATAAVGLALWGQVRHTPLEASSHREAPLISEDPLADNTDLYAFKDPNDANRIVVIANYIPFELPHGGPNYSTFGENIRYEVHVKNNSATSGDDIMYRFTFTRTNQEPTTFFNIRNADATPGAENLKTTYTCEKFVAGVSQGNIITNGQVPANNVGPRSISSMVGLNQPDYAAYRLNAITNATGGGSEQILCAPSDDPFFADLGAIFDLAGLRPGSATDGLSRKNTHSIALSIPVATLQKTGQPLSAAANILDPNYVIGVWASASRPAMQTFSAAAGAAASGTYVQVSRLGMPLTNEVINPIGGKDAWNAATPYAEAAVTDDYLSNPELGLYTANNVPVGPEAPKPAGQTYFGEAVPALAALRTQTKSLSGQPGFGAGFDFRNGAAGLSGLAGSGAVAGTALAPSAGGGFGEYLLVPGKPRSVDIKPIFHTGVPNLPPYQLATGKTPIAGSPNGAVNPLSAGKPFVNNFLTLPGANPGGDMLRLNMAVPATPRNSTLFSNQGLLQAAVLGLTTAPYNTSTTLEFIPNMDGFPNGRRLEDAVDQIELKAIGGLVLAATGLWFDDYTTASPSPLTPRLTGQLSFTTGVEANDIAFLPTFPFVQTPWSGTSDASGPNNGPLTFSDLTVSTATGVDAGTYNNITIASGGVAAFNGPIQVNGTLTVQAGGTLSTQGVLATSCLPITGPGIFVLQAGGTLRVCNPDGITASGATGAIQLTGSRTFSADASYVYNGGEAQLTGAGLPSQVRSLTVNNAAGLTVNNGGVRVAQTLALTNGNLTTSASQLLTLLSTPTAGTALVVNTNGAVVGPATMQRAIDPAFNAGPGYRHYSSPMTATTGTLADLTTGGTAGFSPQFNTAYNNSPTPGGVTPFPNVFGYEQSRVTNPANSVAAFDQGFVVPNASDPMGVLTGYAVNIGPAAVLDLTGTLNTGPVSRTSLTRGPLAQSGWQFLGNPYPSPIDFSQTAGVTRTNVDDAIYIAQSTGQYTGTYRSYVNGMGTPQVAAMQGFFTRVTTAGSPGTFALNDAVRVTTFGTSPSLNRTTETRPMVKLRLQSRSPLIDETTVYFEQGATAAFDPRFDAYKLPNSTGLNLSSIIVGEELSVNGLVPRTAAPVTVPLNVGLPTAGTYTLNAVDLLNFGGSNQVFLLDTQTGARIDLAQQPTYTFTTQATSLTGRFSLYFGPAQTPTATTAAALADMVQLYPNPAHASFTLLLPAEMGRTPVTAQLYNQLGQSVARRVLNVTAAGASAQFEVAGFAPGIYSLRLTGGPAQVVKRVVVE